MPTPQQEERIFDATFLAELSYIAKKLYVGSPHLATLLNKYRQRIEQLCSFVDIEHHTHLLDYLMILIEGLELLSDPEHCVSESECDFLQKIPDALSDYLASPNSSGSDHQMLALLRDPDWIRPISDEEEVSIPPGKPDSNQAGSGEGVALEDLLFSINGMSPNDVEVPIDAKPALDVVTDTPTDTEAEETQNTSSFNPDQQELVDLIKGELSEIHESTVNLATDLASGDNDHRINTLVNLSDLAENISNAANLIGLEGLGRCADFISRNITQLSLDVDNIDANQLFLLKEWPEKLADYLNNIAESTSTAQLLALLKEKAWPLLSKESEYSELEHFLSNPVIHEDEPDKRQITATADDVDLTLPDDVNQELLDGLLIDLPTQTEEFSAAIQNIADGGGIDNIETAQRIAHTLKGAANVVGVKGIANLTHHLEDILQVHAKSNGLPTQSLTDLLVRASDCLEAMTEALLGIDLPPDDAIDVFQEILDWANKLDNEGPARTEIDVEKAPSTTSADAKASTRQQNIQTKESTKDNQQSKQSTISENLLRVPASLADEMLRIAGENIIQTSQIQEQINVIAQKQDSVDIHNQSLQQLSYDLEHLIDIKGFMPGVNNAKSDAVFDAIELDEYHEIHTISRKLVELAADSIQLSNELDRDLSALQELVVDQDQLHKEGEELVLRTRMVPIKTIIPRLKRGVRQAGRLTGKQVELYVKDNNTYMDSDVLNNMIEPLMHILRNSIDHGIEPDYDRIAKGKTTSGTIELEFERKGNQISISIADDGRGLDPDEIYSKALKSGLITADDDLSTENIQRLIFEPGFTTRDNVTQTSGRGIGLDIVSVKIRDLKGSIDISSAKNEGCKMVLNLPITSFSTHSLLVRSRQYVYAVSSRGVEEILYPGIGEVHDVGDKIIYKIGNDAYNAIQLDVLLELPPDRRTIERNARPVLLVKDETGAKTAILVQDVIDSREVVVKSMGSYIPKLNGIIGATVLGNGSVAPVIDLPDLLHQSNTAERDHQLQTQAERSTAASSKPNFILVVDDSLSTRRSLAQFAQDLGLHVRTARDGIDALSIIESSVPDLLLVDMEMPRMNGLELTSHIRATPDIKHIPVIMITSRSTDKHRNTALERGVDYYMIKPFDEDKLAEYINMALEIAS
ncbi:MAG: response regulator [Gammaproteobacteria bacterium]|nr:response regulator [Gammaproteobacteria bacterium]